MSLKEKHKKAILKICNESRESKNKITTKLIKEQLLSKSITISNSALSNYLFQLDYRTLKTNELDFDTIGYFSKEEVYIFLKNEFKLIHKKISDKYKKELSNMPALNDFHKLLTSFSIETIDVFECNSLKQDNYKKADNFYILKIKLFETSDDILKYIEFCIKSIIQPKTIDIVRIENKKEFVILSSTKKSLSNIKSEINKDFENVFFKPKREYNKSVDSSTPSTEKIIFNKNNIGNSTKINFEICFELPTYVNLKEDEYKKESIRARFLDFFKRTYLDKNN